VQVGEKVPREKYERTTLREKNWERGKGGGVKGDKLKHDENGEPQGEILQTRVGRIGGIINKISTFFK